MHVGIVTAEFRLHGRAVVAHAETAGRYRQHLGQQHAVARDAEEITGTGGHDAGGHGRALDLRLAGARRRRAPAAVAGERRAAIEAEIDRARHAVAGQFRPVYRGHRLSAELQHRSELESLAVYGADKPPAGRIALDEADDPLAFLPEQHVPVARAVLRLHVEVPLAGQVRLAGSRGKSGNEQEDLRPPRHETISGAQSNGPLRRAWHRSAPRRAQCLPGLHSACGRRRRAWRRGA